MNSFNKYVKQFKIKEGEKNYNFQFLPGNGIDKGIKLHVPPEKEQEFWKTFKIF